MIQEVELSTFISVVYLPLCYSLDRRQKPEEEAVAKPTSADPADSLSAIFESAMLTPFVVADSIFTANRVWLDILFGDPASRKQRERKARCLDTARKIVAGPTPKGERAAAQHYLDNYGGSV